MSCARTSEQDVPLGVANSCPNVFGCIFGAGSPPSLTGMSCSLFPGALQCPGRHGRRARRGIALLESAPQALQRDVGFTWREASYTSSPSAVEEVEFSISVWTGGLALFLPALPRRSWRCCPPPAPPVREPSERGHGQSCAAGASRHQPLTPIRVIFLSCWAVAFTWLRPFSPWAGRCSHRAAPSTPGPA